MTRRDFAFSTSLLVGAIRAAATDSPWKDSDIIQPKDLAARVVGNDSKAKDKKPLIVHVGFTLHYKQKHIPGAIYAGPGNKPEGLEKLKAAVADLPKDREIILYCGCCPWDKCPNMKPSFAQLRDAGFKNVKAMVIEQNFGTDWIDKGYPVEG